MRARPSIKFAVFAPAPEPQELLRGQVENIGPSARLVVAMDGSAKETRETGPADHALALRRILERTTPTLGRRTVVGVGHRVAHGGPDLVAPARLDADTLRQLEGAGATRTAAPAA